jgi:hypothetical protein
MADIMMRFDIVIGPICNGSKSFDSWLIFSTLKAAVRHVNGHTKGLIDKQSRSRPIINSDRTITAAIL